MSQPDTAREILPVAMDWQHGTDFSPRPMPVEAEEGFTSGIPVEDVPDPIADAEFQAALEDRGEGESTDEEEVPKGSPASGSATASNSSTLKPPPEF